MEHLINNNEELEHRLTEMEEKIDSINTKVTQVVDAILGNPLTKTGGFVSDIDILKRRIENLERKQREIDVFKNKVYWTIGVLVAIFVSIQYFVNIYSVVKK